MPTPLQHRIAPDQRSRAPNRRLYWLAFLIAYAISLSIAIVFLHEDLQTTLIGIAIFTAGWMVSAYMDARLPRDLDRSARNGPVPN